MLLGALAFLYSYTSNQEHRGLLLSTGVIAFFFFFGFRGFIMSDWIIYYDFFYNCEFRDIFDFSFGTSKAFEPGFTILTLMCKALFEDYHFFVVIITAINTVLLLRFFSRYSDNILLCLMLFVVFDGLSIIVNLMRNSISILIFLNALEYLTRRKPLQYFSLCLLAFTFHSSALVYFPLYFFFHLRPPRWLFLTIFIGFNIIYLLNIPIFATFLSYAGFEGETDKIIAYTEKFTSTSKLSIGYLERLLTCFLVLCYYNRLYEIRKGNGVFINALLTYLMFLFVFSGFPVIGHRMGCLFAFAYWILWGDLIKCFFYENNRRLFATFVYLYCILRIIGSTQLPDFEYDNVLFGAKSYEERLYIHNKTFEETF